MKKGLNMVVSTIPWGNVSDLAAVAIALDHMAEALTTIPGLTYLYGPKASTSFAQSRLNLTGAEFLATAYQFIPMYIRSLIKLSGTPTSATAEQTTDLALRKSELTVVSWAEHLWSIQTLKSMVQTIFLS
jgi:hypothetical protein